MNKKILVIVLAALAVLLLLIGAGLLFSGESEPSLGPASLAFWSIEDENLVWRDSIMKFQEQYPDIAVTYTQIPEEAYEQTFINALAQGTGPDVFILKNAWIVKQRDKTFPLPQEFFQFFRSTFEQIFTDGTAQDLILPDGRIIGLPLWVDTPVLLYNKDVFNAAGIAEPPKNWDEVIQVSRALTKKSPDGGIIQSGLAMGAYKNVEDAFGIINSLFLQKGDPVVDRASGRAVLDDRALDALAFYTSFANPSLQNFSWNDQKKNSLDVFAEGDAAMVIAYTRNIARISAKNPFLNFGILPFPQRKSGRTQAVYGEYFFPAVSKLSQNPGAAWQFVLFATGAEGGRIYGERTGLPPARRDIIAQPPQDARNIFFRQSLIAAGWPVPDEQAVKSLFEETINAINTRTYDPDRALSRLRQRLNLFLP